jgi:hypothetical protein
VLAVRRYKNEAEGLAEAVALYAPAVCLFGHHHTRLDARSPAFPASASTTWRDAGNLVALDVLG